MHPEQCLQSLSPQSYLGGHGFGVCDLHLGPHIPGAVRQTPHLLLGHVVLIIDIERQGVVYFSKAVEHVVEPQAVFVVSR